MIARLRSCVRSRPVLCLFALGAGGIFYFSLLMSCVFFFRPAEDGELRGSFGANVYSREGSLLGVFRELDSGAYAEFAPLADYPEHLIEALLAAEDRRFFYHPGIDPLAVLRAAYQNVSAGGIVSGGSTLTQQLARLMYRKRLPRYSYARKLLETVYALRLEIRYDKQRLLEAYMNRAPLAANRIGFSAAARDIFGRGPALITPLESIALVVFLRRSRTLAPAYLRRFKQLFFVMKERRPDLFTDNEFKSLALRAVAQSLNRRSKRRSGVYAHSSHFLSWLATHPEKLKDDIHTEISMNWSEETAALLNAELDALPGEKKNGAVLLLENSPEDPCGFASLRVMVGSRDFSETESGQVNGTLALRNAGSTLKPLIYGMGMERLGLKPYSLMRDGDLTLPGLYPGETYRPKNYDLGFWGRITLREALANSRNIPAVELAARLGAREVRNYLQKTGFSHLKREAGYYGPGLALGAGGATLLQLARVYGMISAGGCLGALRVGTGFELPGLGRRLSYATALRLTGILSDAQSRRRSFGDRNFLDFPYGVAAKTGTSKDYRDSWTIGYTNRYTVAVWVGNFSGAKMPGISGARGAARIFHQVMRMAVGEARPRFTYPMSWRPLRLCRRSGGLAGESCPAYTEYLAPAESPPEPCRFHKLQNELHPREEYRSRIQSPVEGEEYILDSRFSTGHQEIPLIIVTGDEKSGRFTFRLNESRPEKIQGTLRKTLRLKAGKYLLRLYREDEMIEDIRFFVR